MGRLSSPKPDISGESVVLSSGADPSSLVRAFESDHSLYLDLYLYLHQNHPKPDISTLGQVQVQVQAQ